LIEQQWFKLAADGSAGRHKKPAKSARGEAARAEALRIFVDRLQPGTAQTYVGR